MFRKVAQAALALGAGSVFVAGSVASCSGNQIPPPSLNWSHHGMLGAFDANSIRRGHQVYKQICASCHSLERIAFRNLVNVAYTEDEVKAIAAEYDVQDGPNDEGEMFDRPGKLSDYLPSPYPNEETGRFANGGAYPPDLSLMTKARFNGEDYVFALLTGYREPPAGVQLREGLHWNPYFGGGAIAMAKQLSDGQLDYDDGTPASISQMAKDVVTFLSWAAEPENDERKKFGVKACGALFFGLCIAGYYKRLKFSTLKTRRVTFHGQ